MFVSVGDVRLFVDIDGAKLVPDGMTMRERPTIVVVHGGPGFDHTPFKARYASLTEIAQVVYYDHRGNGRSEDGLPERWNLDQWADDLRTLCDVLGTDDPIGFGTSFGGVVSAARCARWRNASLKSQPPRTSTSTCASAAPTTRSGPVHPRSWRGSR